MNDKKLLLYSFISCIVFLLSLTLIACSNQNATVSPQEDIESFEYLVTNIDSTGLYGNSVTDNTKIFIEHETIENLSLKESDHISVSFPRNDWETITKVTKIN